MAVCPPDLTGSRLPHVAWVVSLYNQVFVLDLCVSFESGLRYFTITLCEEMEANLMRSSKVQFLELEFCDPGAAVHSASSAVAARRVHSVGLLSSTGCH